MSRAVVAIVAVAAGLIAGVLVMLLLNPDDESAPSSASEPAPQASGTDPLNGLNLTAYTPEGYARPEVREDLARLKELGSNAVAIVPTWYMKRADSNRVEPDSAKSPSDASIEQAIAWAQEAGLKVILKPHVDVLDGTFRGDIQPSDRAAWFDSYAFYIGIYADLAARTGADVFAAGTELKSLSTETEAWDRLIDTVRGKFGGELTYAANWDEVWQVQFWDRLDMIGVDAYFPLSQEGQQPDEAALGAAWQPNVDGLRALSEQWDRPVVLAEIGYPSQYGATAHPWEVRQGDPPDQSLQADAYQAAFDSFADQDWLRGIMWWSWRADAKTSEDQETDYTPESKEAEVVLAEEQRGR